LKNKLIGWVLWLAMILTMVASIQHLAWVFGTVERPGYQSLGWIPAIAVDAGLVALAYSIRQRSRAKRSTKVLWAGIVGFAIISALANFYYALSVEGVAIATGVIVYAKALVLSATLPAMYIFLGEIVSGDDANAADRLAKQAEREQRRADLAAERDAAEAKRLLLEAERKQTEQAQATDEQPEKRTCPACSDGKLYTQNGLNAHWRVHKVDTEHPNGGQK